MADGGDERSRRREGAKTRRVSCEDGRLPGPAGLPGLAARHPHKLRAFASLRLRDLSEDPVPPGSNLVRRTASAGGRSIPPRQGSIVRIRRASDPTRRFGLMKRRSCLIDRRLGSTKRRFEVDARRSGEAKRRFSTIERRFGLHERRIIPLERRSIDVNRRVIKPRRRFGSIDRRSCKPNRRLSSIDRRSSTSQLRQGERRRRFALLIRRFTKQNRRPALENALRHRSPLGPESPTDLPASRDDGPP
jgi:hypothetical protein